MENYTIEELEQAFSEIKSVKFRVRYTHKLTQTFGPPQCDVAETHTAYFISPTKIIIRMIVENFGFMYCDYFNPMSITIIDQGYDKKKNKFSVNFKHFFRINFVKSVMFFQSKIKSEAISATHKAYNTYVMPLIKEYMQKYQDKFVRPVPKTEKKSKVPDLLLTDT